MKQRKPKRARIDRVKRRLVIRGLLAGMTQKEALLQAGYSPAVAKNPKIIIEPIRNDILKELSRKLNRKDLVEQLVQGLEATRIQSFLTPKGEIVYSKAFPDWSARVKYFWLIVKILGLLPARESKVSLGEGFGEKLALAIDEARRRLDELRNTQVLIQEY
jgi:hypothetical protein